MKELILNKKHANVCEYSEIDLTYILYINIKEESFYKIEKLDTIFDLFIPMELVNSYYTGLDKYYKFSVCKIIGLDNTNSEIVLEAGLLKLLSLTDERKKKINSLIKE